MARADLTLELAKAALSSDKPGIVRVLQTLSVEEKRLNHHSVADRIENLLSGSNARLREISSGASDIQSLVAEVVPRRSVDDLVLNQSVVTQIREFAEEHHRIELLRAHQLEPRSRVLLVGPPGNGKTSLAEAMAHEMLVPMYTVRYEGVIGSYLGETAQRLRRIFEHVSTRHCVLFIDEFDTLGKERADSYETGEMKRVVSSLLLQLDALPSHVVVVTATNHDELLDRAVWRRFDLRISLPKPSRQQLVDWFSNLQLRVGQPLGRRPRTLADRLNGCSFAELENISLNVLRRQVLKAPNESAAESLRISLKGWSQMAQASK